MARDGSCRTSLGALPSKEPTETPAWFVPSLLRKKKCLPPSMNSGNRPFFTTSYGVPPVAGTRKIPPPIDGEKTIVPSRFHEPPRPVGASQRTCGGPPAKAILFSLPSAKNPRCSPSGDQNG